MPEEPFIEPSQRPDLTIDLDSKVGEMTVRQLSEILGRSPSSSIVKEEVEKQAVKEIPDKLPKERKDIKDNKEHKEPKDSKDNKDTKDHKDPKDNKDQKDTKDPKDNKDQKDAKDHKDPKDPKEHKDSKDNKEHKDDKDIGDRKGHLIDKVQLSPIENKTIAEVSEQSGPTAPEAGVTTGVEELVQRIAKLEREVTELKKGGRQPK